MTVPVVLACSIPLSSPSLGRQPSSLHISKTKGAHAKGIRVDGADVVPLGKDLSMLAFRGPPSPKPGAPPCQLLLCLFCQLLSPAHIYKFPNHPIYERPEIQTYT